MLSSIEKQAIPAENYVELEFVTRISYQCKQYSFIPSITGCMPPPPSPPREPVAEIWDILTTDLSFLFLKKILLDLVLSIMTAYDGFMMVNTVDAFVEVVLLVVFTLCAFRKVVFFYGGLYSGCLSGIFFFIIFMVVYTVFAFLEVVFLWWSIQWVLFWR